jgi:hypothetical protein
MPITSSRPREIRPEIERPAGQAVSLMRKKLPAAISHSRTKEKFYESINT